MTTTNEIIRTEIEKAGGINSFPSSTRKGRVLGRPTRFNLIQELHELTDAELNIAFTLGLIGNNGRKGSIVENATLHKTN